MFGLRFFKRGFRRPSYVRCAHYFADGWPLDSLMVMRMPQLRDDLERLCADGFNTIILVVPWRGFQSSQSPVVYDDFYQSQLRLVLKEAERAGLGVILRVAYTHQVMPGPAGNGILQAQLLLTQAEVEEAWLDYHAVLNDIVEACTCCIGAFVSWEELWHAFANWQSLSLDERKRLAVLSGFSAYLSAQGVQHLDCIPQRDSPDYEYYHSFLNQRIEALFLRARKRFPKLGVEARVDRDPLRGGADVRWLENHRFYDLEPARYSYWAPFFGADNQGEAIDVAAAVDSLRQMLQENTQQGRLKGHIVEQFNFIDDTQRFANIHARIHDDGVGEFLGEAAALLKTYSAGYGLWAYRSYRANVLYNAALLDGGRGWSCREGEGVFVPAGGVGLRAQQVLVQQLRPKVAGLPRANPITSLRLRVERSDARSQLRARINGGDWSLMPPDAEAVWDAVVSLDFDSVFRDGLCFELEVLEGAVRIQRLFLYSHVYRGAVRDSDGHPDVYLADIQAMNKRLDRRFS